MSALAAHPAPSLPWTQALSGRGTDCLVLVSLVVSVALYARGTARIWRRAGVFAGIRVWQVNCFAGGIAVLIIALLSPLDPLSDTLFAAHMTQHELLMVVAAPLLMAGRPFVAMLWAFAPSRREAIGKWFRSRLPLRLWRSLTDPVVVLLLHGLVLWVWHIPAWFEAALASEPLHAVQHLMFFASAALFWWSLVHGRYGRAGYGVAVLFVFATALHTSILGALLSVGQRLWYPSQSAQARAWGLTPLEDQQLAGLIMWIPSGMVFVVIGLGLFAAWLGETRRRVRHLHLDDFVGPNETKE
jgi:putative membrane protein